MLIERTQYSDDSWISESRHGAIYRYCTFRDCVIEGGEVDAVFLSCEWAHVEWYWGLFNSCLFVDTTFQECLFFGSNFTNSRLLNCELQQCRFEKDNLLTPCRLDDVLWCSSRAEGCIGLPPRVFR